MKRETRERERGKKSDLMVTPDLKVLPVLDTLESRHPVLHLLPVFSTEDQTPARRNDLQRERERERERRRGYTLICDDEGNDVQS